MAWSYVRYVLLLSLFISHEHMGCVHFRVHDVAIHMSVHILMWIHVVAVLAECGELELQEHLKILYFILNFLIFNIKEASNFSKSTTAFFYFF